MELSDINLCDSENFVGGVPHDWFTLLRKEAPVWWQVDPLSDNGGFWAVTRYDDCVSVNREFDRFSSYMNSALFMDMDQEALEQQRLMMLNMDPPMHTRYRRLVNKGFTPKMIRDLEAKVVGYANTIVDNVCEKGSADFVTEISAELPLQVIAELMGVPQEDRHLVFDWSNRMIGSEDDEYSGIGAEAPPVVEGETAGVQNALAAMELFAYADELVAKKKGDPHEDLISVLAHAEIEGDELSTTEIDLFFLLLAVAGNETTRNLISGAMVAFFDHPDQWQKLRDDRSLLPGAVEEMLRFVTPVMHFRRQVVADTELAGYPLKAGDKVVFWHTSANRDESVFENANDFDITRTPNTHIAFGGGGPHFCLGANLARMEIKVMFECLLDRMPDLRRDGKVERLQSNFINGVKHLPVAFEPSTPVGR